MSARHVLAVLEDDDTRLWGALERAIELADAEQARLTLAKTTDPGRIMRWLAPAAFQSMGVCADELDVRVTAGHRLAAAVEFVPAWIPVTTRLLGQRTTSGLTVLLRRGVYDAFVATDAMLAHNRRLRSELRRLGIRSVAATRRPASPAEMIELTAACERSGVQT